jgi:hypothetical protein
VIASQAVISGAAITVRCGRRRTDVGRGVRPDLHPHFAAQRASRGGRGRVSTCAGRNADPLPAGAVPLACKVKLAGRQDSSGGRTQATLLKSAADDRRRRQRDPIPELHPYQGVIYPQDPNGNSPGRSPRSARSLGRGRRSLRVDVALIGAGSLRYLVAIYLRRCSRAISIMLPKSGHAQASAARTVASRSSEPRTFG